MKVFVNGFPGSWIDDYKRTRSFVTNNVDEADIILQADTTNYMLSHQYLGKKKLIGIILDFADWYTGERSPKLVEYAKEFISKCDVKLTISNTVAKKCLDYGIDVKIMDYPSQITRSGLLDARSTPKKKHFLMCGRLSDPEKNTERVIEIFNDLNLERDGFFLTFTGQEPPLGIHNIKFSKKIMFGYTEPENMPRMFGSKFCTIQACKGDALGLPAIESALCGTIPIVRNIEPMSSIFSDENSVKFKDDIDLMFKIKHVADNFSHYMNLKIDIAPFEKYIRDNAFNKIDEIVGGL